MGYEDNGMRPRQRRSRARRSETSSGRNIDYRLGEEPGQKEPGLDLITDRFKEQKKGAFEHTGRRESADRVRSTSVRFRETASGDGAGDGRRPAGTSGGTKRKSDIYRNPVQKKKENKKKNKKRKIRIILLELFILIAVLLFAGYSYVSSKLNLMTKLPWDPEGIKNQEISLEKQEQMEGYWTIAIFGVDSRNSSVGKGNNADVNMLCNINQETGEIKMVSVYRDTYLNISDKDSYNKINAAYLQGGPEQAVKALNKNMDLDIDDYATFNWKAVADGINILGGIDLELSEAEFYYINAFITETVQATGVPSSHLKKAGMNHLDGVQAVAYGRLRLMDSDYARTERQRKVISLAFEKAKKADWNTLNCIVQTVFPQVSTSVDMADILSMGRNVTRYHLSETTGFPAARAEVTMGKKGACVIPQTLESNVIELHRFLFGDENYIPTDSLKRISEQISADSGKVQAAKPVESVGTGGGVVPKETPAETETPAAEDTESQDMESAAEETEKSGEEGAEGTGEESDAESGAEDTKETDAADEEQSDSEGAVESGADDAEKPGAGETEKPGTENAEKPAAEEKETQSKLDSAGNMIIAPGGPVSGEESSSSGEETDTGVIIRPGNMPPGAGE